jgi:hypothetical protein
MKLYKHIYNLNERSGWRYKTGQWSVALHGKTRSLSTKGWWKLGKWSGMEYLEIEFAIGGEDNMIQVGVALPYLGRVYAGVGLPRRLTKGWIFHRRECTLLIGYVGSWIELRILFEVLHSDEHMRDTGMASYYRNKRERGEELRYNRVQTWPGWKLRLRPNLKDRVLGKAKYSRVAEDPISVVIPMPEGNYDATATRETATWERSRWPFSKKVTVRWNVRPEIGIPIPGKGENSWDCGDDAIYGQIGAASSMADAIGRLVSSALGSRARYASLAWEPSDGWKVQRPTTHNTQESNHAK